MSQETPQIQEYVEKFQQAIGKKDVEAAAACFAEEIYVDYTSVKARDALTRAAATVANSYLGTDFETSRKPMHLVEMLKDNGHVTAAESLQAGISLALA